ncbi:hypothetical protein CTAYLR_010173 [Chrysophaeum taylorii]|uniref:Secreted protein n=1 Tax=Chrysophaeum taylorii TaxID=2483200 RepID=A0AAD7UN02_9STRA|nr:hypothetical protein CTAYLR_010173 [Chrysophaeum taylorii]
MDLRLFLLGAISWSVAGATPTPVPTFATDVPSTTGNPFGRQRLRVRRHLRQACSSHYPFRRSLRFCLGHSLRHLLARADGPAERLPVARTFSRPDARTDGPAERVPVARADAPSDATTIDSPERMPVDHANIHAHHFARDTVHAADLDAVPPPHRDSIDGPIPRANFGSFCEPDVDADDRADQRTI